MKKIKYIYSYNFHGYNTFKISLLQQQTLFIWDIIYHNTGVHPQINQHTSTYVHVFKWDCVIH